MQQDNQINTQRHMRKHFHKRIRCGNVRLDLSNGPQSTTRRSRDSSHFRNSASLIFFFKLTSIEYQFFLGRLVFFTSLIIFALLYIIIHSYVPLFFFLGTRLHKVFLLSFSFLATSKIHSPLWLLL